MVAAIIDQLATDTNCQNTKSANPQRRECPLGSESLTNQSVLCYIVQRRNKKGIRIAPPWNEEALETILIHVADRGS